MPLGAHEWRGPIRELVVKLHERCNLACDHCYMYEAADQHWRSRPVAMPRSTIRQLAGRFADHVGSYGLDQVRVVLHGGEPLLVGTDGIAFATQAFRTAVPTSTRLSFAVQTNGVLLDERWLDLFHREAIRVGVSIDGDQTANDRHRRYADGRSSFDAVTHGIDLLARPEHRDIFGGLLCTVDLGNDPVGTLDSLLGYRPPRIDFLLPHGNWAYPPPGLAGRPPGPEPAGPEPTGPESASAAAPFGTPYADWLVAVFDHWYDAPEQPTRIRLFESIMSLLLGGPSDTEAIGPGRPASIVIETDGTIEGNDALKTTGPDGGATGLDVFAHTFDDILDHPMIRTARMGLAGLGPTCRRCPVAAVCGGGLFAHRFAPGGDFRSPSVYCADLYRLIWHIRSRMAADLSARAAARTTVDSHQ